MKVIYTFEDSVILVNFSDKFDWDNDETENMMLYFFTEGYIQGQFEALNECDSTYSIAWSIVERTPRELNTKED